MSTFDMDAALDQQSGRSMVDATGPSGSYDLVNPSLMGKIVRGILPHSGGTPRKTEELVSEGLQAKPEGEQLTPEQAAELTRAADEVAPTPEAPNTVQHPVTETPPQDVPLSPMPEAEQFAADVAAKQAEELESRTWERNVNLDYIERTEDLGAVLEVNAGLLPTASRKSHAEVEAGAEKIDMSEVFNGPPNQALNSEQLLAGRQMLITMTDNLKTLVDKVNKGTATTEDKAQFDKLQKQTLMLQNFMQGKIREAGRSLNSMKIVARAVNNRDLAAISEMTGGESLQTQAKILQERFDAGANTADVLDTIEQMGPINKRIAALANFWTASILTGFRTQEVNILSNAMFQLVDTMGVRPLAAVISPMRRKMTGDSAGAEGIEVGSTILAYQHGLRDSLLMAGRVLGSGVKEGEYVSSFGGRKIEDITRDEMQMGEALGVNKIPVLSQMANIGQRATEAASYGVLTTSDEFFKAMAYRSSLYRQANRQSRHEGLTGAEAAERASELLNNITQPMNEQALRDAERVTFTNEVGGLLGMMGNSVQDWTMKVPALRFIAPFIKTPVALLDRTIKMSPLAPLQQEFRDTLAKGGADADVALAEMTFGTVVFAGAALMHQSHLITGAGPEDPKQRAALERIGWQANSVKIGDTYFAYNRGLDPLGMAVGAMANMLDIMAYQQEEADAADYAAGTIFALAKYFKDSTYMQGFGELMALVDGRKDPERWAARNLAGFVPTFFRDVESLRRGSEAGPGVVYPGQDFWEYFNGYLDQRLPGNVGDSLPPRRYWDGTLVLHGGGEATYIYNTLSPIKMSFGSSDLASERLAANGVKVTPPSSKIPLGAAGIAPDLLKIDGGAQLYDRMIEVVGEQRRIRMDQVVNNKQFQVLDSGPGSRQAMELEKQLQQAGTDGKKLFYQELLDKDLTVEEHGEVAVFFNEKTLKTLLKKLKRNDLTDEQAALLQEAGTQGVGTKNDLWVPGH